MDRGDETAGSGEVTRPDDMLSIWSALSLGLHSQDGEMRQALNGCGLTEEVLERLVGSCRDASNYANHCYRVLNDLLPDAVSVMALKRPIKVLIDGLPDSLDILAAKFSNSPDRGLFELVLPAEIYVERLSIASRVLPTRVQLDNAIWIEISSIDHSGDVAHATALLEDCGMMDDLHSSLCWIPATVEPINALNLKQTLIRSPGCVKSRAKWLEMFSECCPSRSVYLYPSLPQALAGTTSGYILMKNVGLAHAVQQADGSYAVTLLLKLVPCGQGEAFTADSPITPTSAQEAVAVEEAGAEEEGEERKEAETAPSSTETVEAAASEMDGGCAQTASVVGHASEQLDSTNDIHAAGETAPETMEAEGSLEQEEGEEKAVAVQESADTMDQVLDEAEAQHAPEPPLSSSHTSSSSSAHPAGDACPSADPSEPSNPSTSTDTDAVPTTPERVDASESHAATLSSPPTSGHSSQSASIPVSFPSVSSTAATALDDSAEGLTMAQRRDMKKKREEEEKKKRLQDYISSGTSQSTGEEVRAQGGIKNRFELAKKKQQEQEEERLAKIKNDTARKLLYTTSSTRWTGESTLAPQSQGAHGSPMAGSGGGRASFSQLDKPGSSRSMRNLWEGVLNESKNTEQSRFNQTRQSTIAQFQVTDGTGIVKRRVGEWEEIFVQIAATTEQMKEFLAAAQVLTDRLAVGNMSHDERLAAQERFRESCLLPEDFVINDTHVYSSLDLDHFLHSYLKKLLTDQKASHVPLSCGVYGDSDSKPPIEVFAAVIKTAEGKLYISVTVKAVAEHELDLAVYGVHKICVVSKDHKLFEKLVNIIPEPWMIPSLPGYQPLTYKDSSQQMEVSGVDSSANTLPAADREAETVEGREGDILEAAAGASVDGRRGGEVAGTVSHDEDEGAQSDKEDEAAEEVTHDLDEIMHSMDAVPQGAATTAQASTSTTDLEAASSAPAPLLEQEGQHQESEAIAVGANEEVEADASATGTVPTAPSDVEQTLLSTPPGSPLLSNPTQGSSPTEDPSRSSRMYSARRTASNGSVGSVEDEGQGTWRTSHTPPGHGMCSNSFGENGEDDPLDADLQSTEAEATDELRAGAHAQGIHAHAAPISYFQSDNEEEGWEDGDEDTLDGEMDDDDDGQPNQFGRTISLANVSTFRSYAPAPIAKNAYAKSVHTLHKFSWQVEEEIEYGLPMVAHAAFSMDLSQVLMSTCCRNLFTLRTQQCSYLFTGTLKHASVESTYIVKGNKVLEWIRGAAASGWLIKWPMKSQNFGRVRKRFFVLRDNLLSYFVSKPKNEEEIQRTFSRNTLHLTDNTTITVGRKFLTRCIVITTPIDTLWIRMRRDFSSEAVKWMNELNKAVQFQQRQKYFMTKARIESKWYHESPLFTLRDVDAIVNDATHIKVALFRLVMPVLTSGVVKPVDPPVNCLYSVDICSSEVPRCQLEIVSEEETSMLPSDLSVVKIYDGLLLLGGSHGFLGLGLISRTARHAPAEDTADTPAEASTTSAAPTRRRSATASKLQASQSVGGDSTENAPVPPGVTASASGEVPTGSSRKVVFCWSCQAPTPSQPTPSPPVSSSPSSSSASSTSLPSPHSTQSSNKIEAIAVAQHAHVFAAADTQGTVSLWHLPRTKYLHTLNPHSVLSHRSMHLVVKRLRPKLIAVLNIHNLSPEQGQVFDKPVSSGARSSPTASSVPSGGASTTDSREERITKLQFVVSDRYLVISTQRRLLLITLRVHEQQVDTMSRGVSISEMRGVSFAEGVEGGWSMGGGGGGGLPYSALGRGPMDGLTGLPLPRREPSTSITVQGFQNWVELDRALPGLSAVFDIYVDEESDGFPVGGKTGGCGLPHAGMSFVEWRVVENDDPTPTAAPLSSFFSSAKPAEVSAVKRCTVSRIVWTEVMLTAAVERSKPCI